MPFPYVGEIRMFAGNFAPAGWNFCDGSTLAISENDVLFTLIGTTYGGDGQNTFNLPDLRGRIPLHQGTLQGTTFVIGEMGGVEQVTLTGQQIPQHNHQLVATTDGGTTTNPVNNLLAKGGMAYIQDVGTSPLNAGSVSPDGGSQAHENMQPFLCINFIISLFGVFPSQT